MVCRPEAFAEKGVGGYMTVEAALILSMVFWVYMFLFRCFFGIYDRCVLEHDVAALVLRCVHAPEKELERVWQQETGKMDLEKYLWLELQEPLLKKQGWTFTITGKGEGAMGDCAVTYKAWYFAPENWLRRSQHFSKNEEKKGDTER